MILKIRNKLSSRVTPPIQQICRKYAQHVEDENYFAYKTAVQFNMF